MRSILIAAKELDHAKTRLAPALPPSERRVLAEAMFRDVLAASLGSRVADQVAVITSDRLLLELARAAGAYTIDEEYPRGLNIAVAIATTHLASLGADTVCTVLSDIPMTTGDDIDDAFGAMPSAGPGVVLVPSLDFSGTNMIVRSPAAVVRTRFGRMSLVKHREDCRNRGVPCEVLRLMRPALDLDLTTDLAEFVRAGTTTHTHNHLARLGIAHH